MFLQVIRCLKDGRLFSSFDIFIQIQRILRILCISILIDGTYVSLFSLNLSCNIIFKTLISDNFLGAINVGNIPTFWWRTKTLPWKYARKNSTRNSTSSFVYRIQVMFMYLNIDAFFKILLLQKNQLVNRLLNYDLICFIL